MVGDLSTERLHLRPLCRDDLDLIIELDSDVEVMRFITGRPATPSEAEAELDGAIGSRWLVFDRASGEFLGWVGAIPLDDGKEYEVGWRFRRAAWGHGYATEAAVVLIDALFSTSAQRVFAQTMAVNQRSRAVMERVGLRYTRTFQLDIEDPLPGTELGEVEYEMTRATWHSRLGGRAQPDRSDEWGDGRGSGP